jgi:hypothetical protein
MGRVQSGEYGGLQARWDHHTVFVEYDAVGGMQVR